jgi:prepilin-type N-terminal cleavage/methylation domain-containing protein
MKLRGQTQSGFTLVELLVSMGIFLVICAAMFELLDLSQRKYNTETQMTATYQDARLAMDQIVRDINVSGFPAAGMFSVPPPATQYAKGPVAWSPSYPTAPCVIGTGGGGSCVTPGDYDLIVETSLPGDNFVSWIWYHLDPVALTFSRAVVPKSAGDPNSTVTAAGTQTVLLRNVVNVPGALMPQITSTYPAMFPGGQPVPIFQYTCNVPTTPSNPAGLQACPLAGVSNAPLNIRDVDVTLIVMTPQRDMQTQTLKLVELFGRGHRANPTN